VSSTDGDSTSSAISAYSAWIPASCTRHEHGLCVAATTTGTATSLASSTAATPTSGRGNFARDSPVVCFRCNQTGHIQRFCSSRHGQANGYTGAHRPGTPVHNRAASQNLGKEKVYVKLRFYGAIVNCLVDTGSNVTLIPASMTKGCRILPTRQNVSAANATDIPLLGYTSLPAKLGIQRIVIVGLVTEHVSQFYLGIDWLTDQNAQWDFRKRSSPSTASDIRLRHAAQLTHGHAGLS